MMAGCCTKNSTNSRCTVVQEVCNADKEGILIKLHVLHIRVEEAIAEEGVLESPWERLDQVFGVRCREEGLCAHVNYAFSTAFASRRTEPEYPKSPTATRSVRLFLLGLRKLSVYPSSSMCHMSFLSFLNSLSRYLPRLRLKRAKKAQIRAKRLRPVPSSLAFGCDLKIARRIEVLMSRSRRPIVKISTS